MPVFTEADDADFARLEAHHRWFPNVLASFLGEDGFADVTIPGALNWIEQLSSRHYDFEDAECGLAFVSANGGYECTVWDTFGADEENNLPWAVFVVDNYGVRLLPEYSVFADISEVEHAKVLQRAADELPLRLEKGEFDRDGKPVEVPSALRMELA